MLLTLLSPAKTLDFDTPVPRALRHKATDPLWPEQAAALIATLRGLSPTQVAGLMSLSDNLAALNVQRYTAWQAVATPHNSKPAVLAFNGDVYDGLQAGSLSTADLSWAQRHLVILSGLYGVLRPFDRLQPYRLEMGTRLVMPGGTKDLYAWWGDRIAGHLHQRAAEAGAAKKVTVVNLASQEYARAALRPALRLPVVECVFEEWRAEPGSSERQAKVVSFFAKRARGAMARFIVQGRLTRAAQLRAFSADGYALDAEGSTAQRLVFRREGTDVAAGDHA